MSTSIRRMSRSISRSRLLNQSVNHIDELPRPRFSRISWRRRRVRPPARVIAAQSPSSQARTYRFSPHAPGRKAWLFFTLTCQAIASANGGSTRKLDIPLSSLPPLPASFGASRAGLHALLAPASESRMDEYLLAV